MPPLAVGLANSEACRRDLRQTPQPSPTRGRPRQALLRRIPVTVSCSPQSHYPGETTGSKLPRPCFLRHTCGILRAVRFARGIGSSAYPLYIIKRQGYFIITGKSGLPEVTATDEMALRETADNRVLLFLAVAETHITNRVRLTLIAGVGGSRFL